MKTLGIVGIAKNTGKTTTTNALIEHLYTRAAKIGVTSIGYDGEEFDNITALPKPRIALNKGTLVITASGCIAPQAASYKVLRQTDIQTVLGQIQICRTETAVNTVVAGPKTGDDLQKVIDLLLQDFDCDVLLVDGALNRVAPFVKIENLVIAVGPAANHDLDELAQDIKLLVDLTRLPVWPSLVPAGNGSEANGVEFDPQTGTVWAHGPVYTKTLHNTLKSFSRKNPVSSLILPSVLHLLSGSSFREIQRFMNYADEAGLAIFVKKHIRLLGLTINPAYPVPLKKGLNAYELRYVDEQLFRERLRALLSPESLILNVKKESVHPLLERAI